MGEKGADWLCGLSERAARLGSDAQAGLHDRRNESTEIVPPTAYVFTNIVTSIHRCAVMELGAYYSLELAIITCFTAVEN